MKIIKTSLKLLVAVALLNSCTAKFEEFNTNPFAPKSSDMNADNVETGSNIASMMPMLVYSQENDAQMVDQMVSMEYGRQIATIQLWGNGGNGYTYNMRTGWIGSTFSYGMTQTYTNFFKIKEITKGEGLIYAWAQIMRVAGALKVSDTYGPIPYSKVDGGTYTVAYDDMPTLYNAMFDDLDAAMTTIKGTSYADGTIHGAMKDFDRMYEGNFQKWLRFANSLKLRMAIRISGVAPELAKQKAEEAVRDGVITEVADRAWRTYPEGQNPYYIIAYLYNGGEFRLSGDLTSYMNGYNDPRRMVYYNQDDLFAGRIHGARNGVLQTAETFSQNQAKATNIVSDNKASLLVMSAAEPYFLRAEGALLGWDMGGTAKELYEKGVSISMDERGVKLDKYLTWDILPKDYVDPCDNHNDYTAVSKATPKWNADDRNIQLEQILIQKWIANFPNGWESWADHRRTGYPKWMPVVDNLSGGEVDTQKGIQRLPYPQSEYNTNTANVQAAVQMLGGADNGGTPLWWAKKN